MSSPCLDYTRCVPLPSPDPWGLLWVVVSAAGWGLLMLLAGLGRR